MKILFAAYIICSSGAKGDGRAVFTNLMLHVRYITDSQDFMGVMFQRLSSSNETAKNSTDI